jgi:hypothetical protein
MSSSLGVAGVAALRQSCRSCGHPQPRNLATFDGHRSRVRPVTGAARGNYAVRPVRKRNPDVVGLFPPIKSSSQLMPERGVLCLKSALRRRCEAWPLAARAQQPERKRRIGVLMAHAENDAEFHDYLSAFRDGLQKLGWRNSAETTRGRLCCIRTSSQSCPNIRPRNGLHARSRRHSLGMRLRAT